MMMLGIVSQAAAVPVVLVPAEAWALSPALAKATNWSSIIWSSEGNQLVAVAASGESPRMMTSTDGVVWTPRGPEDTAAFNSICEITSDIYAGRLVAVGIYGNVRTSDDGGNTWADHKYDSSRNYSSVCWSPELKLLVKVNRASIIEDFQISTSLDGVAWSPQVNAIASGWESVVWAASLGRFIVLSGNQVMSSADGVTWVGHTPPPAGSGWRSLAWSPSLNLLVAVGSAGGIMTSSDGNTWTKLPAVVGATTHAWSCVRWSVEANTFIACASNRLAKQIMVSSDGVNWQLRLTPINYASWQSVVWATDLHRFVAVASTEAQRVMVSNPS